MKTLSKILLITFLITISSFELKKRKLSEIEKNEIDQIFYSMMSSPSKPLPTLLQNCENKDKNKTCPLCQTIIKQIRELIIKKYGYEGLLKFFISLCNLALDADFCENGIRGYGPVFFDSLSKLIKNEKKLCQIINLCE